MEQDYYKSQASGAKARTSGDGLHKRRNKTAAGQEVCRTTTTSEHNTGNDEDSNMLQDVREAEAKTRWERR